MDLLSAFKDPLHLVLALGCLWAVMKYFEQKKTIVSDLEKERKDHREMVEDLIKAALNNGIQEKFKGIMRDEFAAHERRESENLTTIMSSLRVEKQEAHSMIGKRTSDLEQRVSVVESLIGRPRAQGRRA